MITQGSERHDYLQLLEEDLSGQRTLCRETLGLIAVLNAAKVQARAEGLGWRRHRHDKKEVSLRQPSSIGGKVVRGSCFVGGVEFALID